jgi:hypothetical protein
LGAIARSENEVLTLMNEMREAALEVKE